MKENSMTIKQAIIAGFIGLNVILDPATISDEQVDNLFHSGQLVQIEDVNVSPGGTVSNTGLALHQLGVPVRLVGKIGDDSFGKMIQDRLRAHSLHLADDLVIDLSLPTGKLLISIPTDPEQPFLHSPGANATFYASDLPRRILEEADLFHFGNPSEMRSVYRGEAAELVSILQRARRAGLTTSLEYSLPDPASPAFGADWAEILANTLPLVDVYVPSLEELVFLLHRATDDRVLADNRTPIIETIEPGLLTELANKVLDYGVKVLLINCSHRGIYLRTAPGAKWEKGGRGLEGLDETWHDRELWAPPFCVTVNGTAGAGDTTLAGFLSSILRGTGPETALRIAAAMGPASVETALPPSELPTWEEMIARVNGGWETHPLELGSGWCWDPGQGLWEK